MEKCDLYELCSQATNIVSYQVQTKGLEMLLNIPPDLPRFIYADSIRIKQVLVNLLGNAAKFTEKGEIELQIEKIGGDDLQSTICFSVRDTGIGIREDKQQKIFDAFSQEDSSTTKRYGGTGLGLTISNKLLGLMGSKLELKSKIGTGSTFYFQITFRSEPGEAFEWENISNVKDVLVVDDNDNNRHIVSAMLLLKNIRTTEAANGFEALQLLAKDNVYDAIIMDYHMPYMDGLETIRKIRESFLVPGKEQPVILLYSSSDDGKIIRQCEELNVTHRLVKPLKMQDIYNALSRLHLKDRKSAVGITENENQRLTKAFRVLIAEDNTVNMFLARTIVKNIAPNAELIEAANGIEAMEYCRKQLPDIILMDVQMPEMNGYEATKAIRAILGAVHIPIIALTAGNVKGEREKCLGVGMDDFLVKPIVESDIVGIFNKWLDFTENNFNKWHLSDNDIDQHFDVSVLERYLDNNSTMIRETLAMVARELVSSISIIELSAAKQDIAELNSAGHKLYGTATASGLHRLSELANDLQFLDKAQIQGLPKLVDDLSSEINTVIQIINNFDQ